MADYTFSTTNEQEALLTWIVANYNAEKDLSLTNQDYILLQLPTILAPYAAMFQQATIDQVKTLFASADPAVQAQVKSLLGIT